MKIYEQKALQMPNKKKVYLKMCNLRLHSSGVFSNVYRGTLLEPEPSREIVVKKTWPEKSNPNDLKSLNLELIMLLALSRDPHKNIVQVLFAFQSIPDRKEKRICESMVFDFMPQTLNAIIRNLYGPPLNIVDVKLYTWQLFNGLDYLMKKKICHRDIKPQNILVNSDAGNLKIGDFGSAKHIDGLTKSSPYQVTRFYRPPELLLESDQCDCFVDVWSAGCCLGEMARGIVLFPGRESKHQLKLIIRALGSPTDDDIIAMKTRIKVESPKVAPKGLESLLHHAPKEFVRLLQRVLVYNPRNRLCGRNILLDPFFNELFIPGKRRINGRLISDVIFPEDLHTIQRKRKKKDNNKKSNSNKETLKIFKFSSGKESPVQNQEGSNGTIHSNINNNKESKLWTSFHSEESAQNVKNTEESDEAIQSNLILETKP